MPNKEEKFKELATNRVNKALNLIRLIGNLSNKSHYSYSDEEARKIISTLENEIKLVKSKFLTIKKKSSNEFTLK